jgi:hypothetical protein
MEYDPATTFVIYMVALGAIFTICAAVADLLTARAERKARRQARAEARAKLREERDRSYSC